MEKIFIRLNKPKRVAQNVPPVILSLTAYKKIVLWTRWAAKKNGWEVSGVGTCLKRHGGYYVNDVWLIEPEKVGAAHVDMDPAHLNKVVQEVSLLRSPKLKGYDKDIKQYMQTGTIGDPEAFMKIADTLANPQGGTLRSLRFHWHSHANFGVGWSGTDERTARRDFCPDADWTISVVTNAQGHFLARQDFPRSQCEPKHELPVFLLHSIPGNISSKYLREYNNKHRNHVKVTPAESLFDEMADLIGDTRLPFNPGTPTARDA